MKKYLLDSSIIIEALRVHLYKADEFLIDKYGNRICISIISTTELFSGKSTKEEAVFKYVEYLIRSFEIIELSAKIAYEAGIIRRDFSTKIADAIIAASALENNLTLVTHNQKDFIMIRDLKLKEPYKAIKND